MSSTFERPTVERNYESSSTATEEAVSPLESPPPPPRRQPSIRFSQETNTESRPSTINRRRPSESDEITPIRQADGHSDRRYNTTDDTEAVPGSQQQVSRRGSRRPVTTTSQTPTDATPGEAEDKLPWYKQIDKWGALTLENKGSVARDHLALERTFLAWLRTSLAFASIGIAITQLFRLNTAIASHTKRYTPQAQHAVQSLPFSPLIGHSVPEELVQFLQWQSQQNAQAPQHPPTLGPTLLDQLLLLPPQDSNGAQIQAISPLDFTTSAFDEDAAARLRHVGKPLGATFLAISIVILLVGFHRYFEAQFWIVRGKFPASRASVALVAFVAGALIVASLVVVLVVAPNTFEKK